jgi:hypothetical protein
MLLDIDEARIAECLALQGKLEDGGADPTVLLLEAVKGTKLEPSEITAIDLEGLGNLILSYDDPWPKGTVLVAQVGEGAEWVSFPFVVANVSLK